MTNSPRIAAKMCELLRAGGSRYERAAASLRRPMPESRIAPVAASTVAGICAAAMAACVVAVTTSPALADHGEIYPPGLPCGYTVEVIEGPKHPTWGWPALMYPQGLNEHGHATGYYKYPLGGNEVGFYWTPQNGLESIEPPQGVTRLRAYDLNNQNVIVGEYKHGSEPWLGFVYDTNTGEWTELEPVDPTGSGQASANAINNAGVVAGTRSIGNTKQPYNAFIWSAEDGYTDLGVMEGPNSRGITIDELGKVAGWTGSSLTSADAFRWNGTTQILPRPDGADSAIVHDGSDAGYLCGSSVFEGNAQAVLWNTVDNASHLFGPEPDMTCFAGAVGEEGTTYGSCRFLDVQNVRHAAVWVAGDGFFLEDLIDDESVSPSRVLAVNSTDQVLARGTVDGSGSNVGILLTPVKTPNADLNGDCEVGADDLGLLLSEWNRKDSPADLTGDGTVGGADLGILLSNWTR